MLLKFTEEQMMIRDMVREFTKAEVEPMDKWMDDNGWSWDLYKKLVEAGLVSAHIPEQYGGGGGDPVTSTIIIHELSKGSASLALAVDISWVASDMILLHGTEEQKNKYLPMAAEGKIFAFGLTEESAGSDAAGIKSVAKKQEDGSWVLNGSKSWITNSGIADVYIIMVITDPTKGANGISAFIVPNGTPGFKIGKHEEKMGMRGTSTCELIFDDLRLPADALLSDEGMGFKIAMQGLDGGRISVAAISTGLSQHAYDMAKDYANERKTFGKPIAKHQAIQFMFADMATQIKAMEYLTYAAAYKKASGARCTLEAAQAKLFASELCTQICLKAVQIFGGNGYSKECHVERFVRDAKLLEIGEGTSEILRMVIGGTVLASK